MADSPHGRLCSNRPEIGSRTKVQPDEGCQCLAALSPAGSCWDACHYIGPLISLPSSGAGDHVIVLGARSINDDAPRLAPPPIRCPHSTVVDLHRQAQGWWPEEVGCSGEPTRCSSRPQTARHIVATLPTHLARFDGDESARLWLQPQQHLRLRLVHWLLSIPAAEREQSLNNHDNHDSPHVWML